MDGIVGRRAASAPAALLLPLEQPQPVLELCDAEREPPDGLLRARPELGRALGGEFPSASPEPYRFSSPALEDVREHGADLVALDTQPIAELGSQLVGVLRDEGYRADAREGE